MDAIEDRRANLANEWLKHSLPDMTEIRKLSAGQINQYLSNLRKMPPVLLAEQMETVNRSVAMCDLRLDELDVEGVMVKFQGLSDKNKRTFVGLISEYWNNENDIA